MRLAGLIGEYGVQAVLGRPVLSFGEINRLETAKSVVREYNARKNATNAAQFAEENQEALKLLLYAEKLVNDG